jgi:hypothetical protein
MVTLCSQASGRALRHHDESRYSALGSMSSPCRRCGATKTEPAHGRVVSTLVRLLGYRLRRCSRCRRWRVLPPGPFLGPKASTEPDYGSNVTATPGETRGSVSLQWATDPFDPDGFSGCPRCGGLQFERTRRRWLERTLKRPRMARCRACRKRFPYPQA